MRYGVVQESVAVIFIAVVASTMAATPLMTLLNERLLLPRAGTRGSMTHPADLVDDRNPVATAGFGSLGGVMGRRIKENGL